MRIRVRVVVVGSIALGVIGCSCHRHPDKADLDMNMSGNGSIMAVDVLVVSRVAIEQPNWKGFTAYKCAVLRPHESGLVRGQDINIVAADPLLAGRHVFVNTSAHQGLAVGQEYSVLLGTRLPKGWDAIAPEFNDERLGFAALVGIEQRNRVRNLIKP